MSHGSPHESGEAQGRSRQAGRGRLILVVVDGVDQHELLGLPGKKEGKSGSEALCKLGRLWGMSGFCGAQVHVSVWFCRRIRALC